MLKLGMLPNPVDVYYNTYATQLFDDPSGVARVFSFLERLYAEKTTVPWDVWFEEKEDELHAVIQHLQQSPSYSVYVEHLFAGMPYWNADNLTNAVHISSLTTMHREINEATWHGLGQRENGQILKTVVDAATQYMGRDFMKVAMRASPHATAIGFYNDFLAEHTHRLENNDYSSELYAWCDRLSNDNLPLTQTLFLSNYSSASFLWAVHALKRAPHNEGQSDVDIKLWIIEQPAQSEALYAYLMHETHYWKTPPTLLGDATVNEKTWRNAQLIKSIYPDIPSVGQYVHAYTELFNQTPFNAKTSLPLPVSFEA